MPPKVPKTTRQSEELREQFTAVCVRALSTIISILWFSNDFLNYNILNNLSN
jgi:hypothetical protein